METICKVNIDVVTSCNHQGVPGENNPSYLENVARRV
jgi:hypothetical protein